MKYVLTEFSVMSQNAGVHMFREGCVKFTHSQCESDLPASKIQKLCKDSISRIEKPTVFMFQSAKGMAYRSKKYATVHGLLSDGPLGTASGLSSSGYIDATYTK